MGSLDRRSFLRSLVAAPAVVAIGSLMPVRGIIMSLDTAYTDFDTDLLLVKGYERYSFNYNGWREMYPTEGGLLILRWVKLEESVGDYPCAA